MSDTDIRFQIEEALETWPKARPEDLAKIIADAERLAEETVAEFNATPGAAYFACQSEYGCDWKWDVDAEEPTARVYDCDGETIDRLTLHDAELHAFGDAIRARLFPTATMTTTEAPRHKTTVDQDRGPHHSGARYTQLTDIITDYSDHNPVAWDRLSDEDREWWTENLEDYHAAVVAVAELSQEVRGRIAERLLEEHSDDMASTTSIIRRLIEEES